MAEEGYRATLNLPRTSFPMKANLVSREPQVLSWWKEKRIYEQIQERQRTAPRYILHDGPPYANGHIHIGHALNKILKDIIIKAKTMDGFAAPYVPGWDCHGLPIEHQVVKELGPQKKDLTRREIRRLCRAYAEKYIAIQREEFRRLGVFGDWGHPYLTMDPSYEAAILREFARIVASGGVYRGKKPVFWCYECETALAEAEVQYEEHTSPSIYVTFRVADDPFKRLDSLKGKNPSFVIWTTTPWTLVANQAVCVHPEYDYQAVRVRQGGKSEEIWIIAKELVEQCVKECVVQEYSVIGNYKGRELEHVICYSPFVDPVLERGRGWTSRVVLGRHVTVEQGTGCVHTAPGHGQEDYEVGLEYGLSIFAPVDSQGLFTPEINGEVSALKGVHVHQANDWIIERLSEIGTLVKKGTVTHSYPYCWRCKNPVIVRATEQWFISMEVNDLRQRALQWVEKTTWVPPWGKERIQGMISARPDWCISRQRAWGVPIPALICRACGERVIDPASIEHFAACVEEKGTDIWFFDEGDGYIPQGIRCPKCGGGRFEKEADILDVWFESGVSHAAVLVPRSDLGWPADLYLEGSDQHRGWFHSSLLASVGARGESPYKMVLTHGFVVDGSGKKMSKSAGNVIAPQEVINQYGAEILRLWVAAENYREDIRISQEILSHLVEAYRKIRNTCRYLLGNLYDFDPERDSVPDCVLLEIDRWALHRLQSVIARVRKAYAEFEFHIVFHTLNNFCSVDLSAFYLDILKDRLYTCRAASPERRAAQTVLYKVLTSLTQMMAPILCFTAEEVWQDIPLQARKEESIHLARFPVVEEGYIDEALASRWDRLIAVRDEVARAVEKARVSRMVGSSLDAAVSLFARGDLWALLTRYENDLPTFFIVSQVSLREVSTLPRGVEVGHGGDLGVMVSHAEGRKCERCWNWSRSVGVSARHPTLCPRCADVVG